MRRPPDPSEGVDQFDALAQVANELSTGADAEVAPQFQRDEHRRWIAAGLGVEVGALDLSAAQIEEGAPDVPVYVLRLQSAVIAVTTNGLTACLSRWRPGEIGPRAMLAQYGIHNPEESALAELDTVGQSERYWHPIAAGMPPEPARPRRLVFTDPRRAGAPLARQELVETGSRLSRLFASPRLEASHATRLRPIAVTPGDVVARLEGGLPGRAGVDVFSRAVPPPIAADDGWVTPGLGVRVSEAGSYCAARYGYLCLLGDTLEVVNPVWVSPDAIYAQWVLLERSAHPVTEEMVRRCLREVDVLEPTDDDKVRQLTAQVREGVHKPGYYILAEGVAPTHGVDAIVEILVDTDRRAGTQRDDGSLDFRDVNFYPNVQEGEVVARRTPPRPGVPGRDLRGSPIEARPGQDHLLRAGENISVVHEGDQDVYHATIPGLIRVRDDRISAVPVLAVRGDVSYSTGNLQFDGDIFVNGSVIQGFSVRATGDVTVTGTIEAGTEVHASGDLTVGRGIVGRKSTVTAQGRVRAQFVQEAKVRAGRDLELGSYTYHANLRVGGRVRVRRSTESRGGAIIGGQTWALQGIEARSAGTVAAPETVLVAGVDPQQALHLDKLESGIETTSRHMIRILDRFGLTRIDLGQIRNMVAASTGPRRTILVRQARQLAEVAQVYHRLLKEREQLNAEVGESIGRAYIEIGGSAHPNVVVRVGAQERKLDREIRAPRFHLRAGRLVER